MAQDQSLTSSFRLLFFHVLLDIEPTKAQFYEAARTPKLLGRQAASSLVEHGVDLVPVFHLELVRGLLATEPTTIK